MFQIYLWYKVLGFNKDATLRLWEVHRVALTPNVNKKTLETLKEVSKFLETKLSYLPATFACIKETKSFSVN